MSASSVKRAILLDNNSPVDLSKRARVTVNPTTTSNTRTVSPIGDDDKQQKQPSSSLVVVAPTNSSRWLLSKKPPPKFTTETTTTTTTTTTSTTTATTSDIENRQQKSSSLSSTSSKLIKLIPSHHGADSSPEEITVLDDDSNDNNNDNVATADEADLNPIDARKKQIINSLKSRVCNNLAPTAKQSLTRAKLASISDHEKAKKMLAKSHQSNFTSATSLSLTQSLNVAKLEQQARVQAFEAAKRAKQQQQEQASGSEMKTSKPIGIAKPTPSVRLSDKPIGASASSSDHQLSKQSVAVVQPTKQPIVHQFKPSSSKLRNQTEKQYGCGSDVNATEGGGGGGAGGGSVEAIKSTTITTSPKMAGVTDKNDIVGNILCQMNKQNLISSENTTRKPETSRHNELFTIENFFYRILKCTYNWLLEQG